MASPRRSGATATEIIVCETGITPPSTAPIRRRAANSIRKDCANPLRKEQTEKASVAAIRNVLRLPLRSAAAPTITAESAQLKESADAVSPTCVLVRPSSGCTNGIRKLSALRSKNRMPKLRLRRPTSSD